jgi:hypothetical protein
MYNGKNCSCVFANIRAACSLRSICPGQHLANIGLWSAMATLLAAVDISKALDEHGKEVTPPIAFSGGLTIAFPGFFSGHGSLCLPYFLFVR